MSIVNWARKHNYCDPDEKLEDFYNDVCRSLAWDAFQNQEDVVYMMHELGNGRKPKLKDDCIDVLDNLLERSMIGDLKTFLIAQLIFFYSKDDIDIPKSIAEWVNDYLALDDEDKIVGVEDEPNETDK